MNDVISFLTGAFLLFLIMLPVILWWDEQQNRKRKKVAEEARRKAEHDAYMEKKRKEEEARLAEERKQKEERDRLIAEKNVAYDRMISDIKACPVIVSNEKAKKIAISFLHNLTYSTITVKSDMDKLGNFVVIDTETMGLKVVSDEIIEIAAIRFRNFKPVEKFTTLCSPNKPIPERIIDLTHITDEMVTGKPSFQQVAQSLVRFIGDDNIVGHNLPFDLKFIVHYGANVTEKKRKYFDTFDLARKTLRGEPNYKLKIVCTLLGVIYRDAHRAENDAIATGLVFKRLAEIRKNR